MLDRLGERARTHGAAAAVVADEGIRSWSALDAAAERAARRLAARGVRPGDRVATTLGAGLPFVELLHGAPRLGAVLVPLSPRLGAAERRWQRRDAAPRLVVEEPLDGPEEGYEPVAPDPDRPHTLLYTSGTTGRPRPVVLTRGNHEASARASGERLGLGPEDTWLSVLAPSHVGGLALLLRAAAHGSRLLLHPGWDQARALEALGSGAVTRVSLVPTQLHRLLRAGLGPAPGLRTILLGGAPAPRELLERAGVRGLPVVVGYGATETASLVVAASGGEALASGGAAGLPLRGVELRIGTGEELLVRGPMVAPGVRDGEGWLHTGDLGRLDAQGRLWVTGRAVDVIVTGGEKVAPDEVEEALRDHPAVRDAGVAGRPDQEWGEAVTAWVVLERAGVGDAELLDHLRARLAPHAVPKRIHRVRSLPRTPAGKLLRRLL